MEKDIKNIIFNSVDKNLQELLKIKKYLYENPEVGGTEEKASTVLISFFKENGFTVTEDFGGVKYCFRAVFDSGNAGRTIGYTLEYDALPDIGHGCGHNIIATAPLGAALALKDIVQLEGGKVVAFGTPGEENIGSKVVLANKGLFDEVDVCLTAHPNPVDCSSGTSQAIDVVLAKFYGKTSHAAAAPEMGINALDAAVHLYNLIGFEKQYLPRTSIYGIFVDGGTKCSVIPDTACLKYYLRARTVKELKYARKVFERCAKAAQEATGARAEVFSDPEEPPYMDMVTNRTLSDVFDKYYEEITGKKLMHPKEGGSTDMGDVSHVVPSIHPYIGIGCPDAALHSVQFADATMTTAGDKAVENGAKALAMTGAEVLLNEELFEKIREEFNEAKKAF